MINTPEEALRTLRLKVEWSGLPPLFIPQLSGKENQSSLVKCYEYLVEGRFEDAITGFTALRSEINEDFGIAALLNLIAYCQLEAGDHEAAKGTYMLAMSEAQKCKNIPIQLDALIGISITETFLGEYKRAKHIVLHGLVVSSGDE